MFSCTPFTFLGWSSVCLDEIGVSYQPSELQLPQWSIQKLVIRLTHDCFGPMQSPRPSLNCGQGTFIHLKVTYQKFHFVTLWFTRLSSDWLFLSLHAHQKSMSWGPLFEKLLIKRSSVYQLHCYTVTNKHDCVYSYFIIILLPQTMGICTVCRYVSFISCDCHHISLLFWWVYVLKSPYILLNAMPFMHGIENFEGYNRCICGKNGV